MVASLRLDKADRICQEFGAGRRVRPFPWALSRGPFIGRAMIVCHCQSITDHDIRTAVGWMRAADPETLITPRKVYRALGRDADCGGCMPLFLDTMRRCEALPVAPRGEVPAALRGLRTRAG